MRFSKSQSGLAKSSIVSLDLIEFNVISLANDMIFPYLSSAFWSKPVHAKDNHL